MIGTEKLCGTNSTLDLLQLNHIGTCFLQLCLVCPIHALLVAINVFYLAKYTTNPIGTNGLLSQLVKLNQFLSAVVVLASLIQGVASVWLQTTHPPSYYLSLGFEVFAWFLTFFEFQLKRRPPVLQCVLIILCWGTTVTEFSSFILRIDKKSINNMKHRIENYGIIIRLLLQTATALILLILRVKWPPSSSLKTRLHSGIQAEYTETDKLLGSEDYRVYYSGVSRRGISDELNTVDENSNFLSRMTFCWVYKLMEKGLKGKIEVPEDVFCLPPSLLTKPIAKAFQSILDSLQKTTTQSKISNSMRNSQKPATVMQKWFLLKALHKAFGVRYYSIGILKFLGDCLGFAGPLLLHALVSFMENKNVSKVTVNI